MSHEKKIAERPRDQLKFNKILNVHCYPNFICVSCKFVDTPLNFYEDEINVTGGLRFQDLSNATKYRYDLLGGFQENKIVYNQKVILTQQFCCKIYVYTLAKYIFE